MALFRRSILGQCPSAPCSPGPFVLLGFGKRVLLEKGSFQKGPFSRDLLRELEILEILEIKGNPNIL